MGIMIRILAICILMLSISSLNTEMFDKNELHEFREFLISKNIHVDENDLLYRFYVFKRNQQRIHDENQELEFNLEENQFTFLTPKESEEILGFGVEGDDEEYEHLLKNYANNPNGLETFFKNQIQMKLKIIKNDKKNQKIRDCDNKTNEDKKSAWEEEREKRRKMWEEERKKRQEERERRREERRKQREERKRKWEEERKRRQEERKKRREERRKKQEERRKKREEKRKKREEERRRKDENEEEKRKREEEEKRKREEEDRRKREE